MYVPALARTMLGYVPKLDLQRWKRARREGYEVTSVLQKTMLAGIRSRGGWRSPITTLQSREESRRAVARPIPSEESQQAEERRVGRLRTRGGASDERSSSRQGGKL